MALFQYRALQADGTIADGEIEAGGRQEAFRQMEGRGLRPIRLAERNGGNRPAKNAAKIQSRESAKEPTKESKPAGSPLSMKLSLGGGNKSRRGCWKTSRACSELAGCRGAAQPRDGHSLQGGIFSSGRRQVETGL
jgi:hypothetical protein